MNINYRDISELVSINRNLTIVASLKTNGGAWQFQSIFHVLL